MTVILQMACLLIIAIAATIGGFVTKEDELRKIDQEIAEMRQELFNDMVAAIMASRVFPWPKERQK